MLLFLSVRVKRENEWLNCTFKLCFATRIELGLVSGQLDIDPPYFEFVFSAFGKLKKQI